MIMLLGNRGNNRAIRNRSIKSDIHLTVERSSHNEAILNAKLGHQSNTSKASNLESRSFQTIAWPNRLQPRQNCTRVATLASCLRR